MIEWVYTKILKSFQDFRLWFVEIAERKEQEKLKRIRAEFRGEYRRRDDDEYRRRRREEREQEEKKKQERGKVPVTQEKELEL